MLCGRYNAGCFNLDALPGINVYSDQRFSPETDIHSNKMTSPQMPRRESLASISQRRLQAVKSKSIYVLPNAFTAAALFAAYYGITQAMNGHFSEAAIAVFFSMLFDGMDGRVARLTHTQSEFGVQMDSLADAVSFGIAPALIVYEFALVEMGKIGWAVSFVYALCALLRLARHEENTHAIARYLSAHPGVEAVFYPGLESDPGYAVNRRQSKGAGGVLSYRFNEEAYDLEKFVKALKLFQFAVSLGSVESLISIPATMTHESYAPELQKKLGITPNLIRVAVGIEDIEDLIADFEQAFAAAKR